MAMRTLEPGLRLGKYEIVAHIATGGMGAVYKAIDQELRRTVALKVLPSRSNPTRKNVTNLERFKREARHAARLSHPNIVTLYEYGYDEIEDVYFLAMEFIDGHDLAHVIARKGRLPPQDARHILKQAAQALEHAYSQGVIHRDIKPSNFLLTRVGSKTMVKLTDMGLAIVADDEEFRMTRARSEPSGTIDYMAPEQARDSRAADIRSDIYSLGCTAYHMLAGKAPFAEGGLGERVYKHQNVPPADVRAENPSVSAGFWGVLQKMLAKKPADRYATPSDLVADLKRISAEANDEEPELAPLPVIEPPPRPAETLREPTTPPETATYTETTEIDAPRPRKKRPRVKAEKSRFDPWRLVVPGIGLCVLVVVALIGWEALKGRTRREKSRRIHARPKASRSRRLWGKSSCRSRSRKAPVNRRPIRSSNPSNRSRSSNRSRGRNGPAASSFPLAPSPRAPSWKRPRPCKSRGSSPRQARRRRSP